MRHALIVVAMGVASAGCANSISSYVQLNATPAMAPRPAAAVEIFSTPHVQHPYVEVGVMGIAGLNSLGGQPTWDELINRLRQEAGERGCDALYLLGRVDNFIQGTCLVYTDKGSPMATPPGPPPPPAQ
jgi:hypothetical protein